MKYLFKNLSGAVAFAILILGSLLYWISNTFDLPISKTSYLECLIFVGVMFIVTILCDEK